MVAPPKQIISHKSVHWYQFIENAWWWILGPWQRKRLMLKAHFFPKNAPFSPQNKPNTFVLLMPAPNMSKHISRNRGATINASQKTADNKDFLFWDKKAISPRKMVAPSKKWYSPKSVN